MKQKFGFIKRVDKTKFLLTIKSVFVWVIHVRARTEKPTRFTCERNGREGLVGKVTVVGYRVFSLHNHVGIQNNEHILHNQRVKFPKDFFAIVLYPNTAAVMSCENTPFSINDLLGSCLNLSFLVTVALVTRICSKLKSNLIPTGFFCWSAPRTLANSRARNGQSPCSLC